MPNRILREGVTSSAKLDQLSTEAEVFFFRLLVVVDDFGRAEAIPSLLRSKCFPTRVDRTKDSEMVGWVEELCRADLAYIYRVLDKTVLQLLKTDPPRAKSSKLPDPPKGFTRLRTLADICSQTQTNDPYSLSYSLSLSSSKEPAEPSAPPPPKARKKPSGDHSAFIDWWCKTYEEILGVPYTVDGAKDGAAAKWILSRHVPSAEIARRAREYLQSSDPFYVKSGKTLAKFKAAFVSFATVGKTPNRDEYEVREPASLKKNGKT